MVFNNKIKKIVFLGDLLRVQDSIENFADRSLGWEFYMFEKQIELATGIKPILISNFNREIFDRDKFYQLSNYDKPSFDNWIKILSGAYTKTSIEYFKECFKESLVITQVAGALKNILEDANIPYIDIHVSAIKFMEDIHLAFRTNVTEVLQKIILYKLPEDIIHIEANKIRSYYWARNSYLNNYEKNSLLLCGQTEVDLSIIKNNKLVSFLDYKKKIYDLMNQYSKVYYKPHPYCNPSSDNEKFIRSFNNIELTNDNFYRLMSTEEIVAVAALSSGTLKEGEYFEKTVYTISHPFMNYYKGIGELHKDDFIILADDYFSPTFWADILSPVIETKNCNYFNFQNRNNLLRETLNVRWGYEIAKNHDFTEDITKMKNQIQELNYSSRNYFKSLNQNNLVNEVYFHDKDEFFKIHPKDITVVVQGAIDKNITPECLLSIKKFLPESEIVLSTWNNSLVENLVYDKLILNEDPRCVKADLVNNLNNNQNRQLISTREGLNQATRKFVLKLRTDFILTNNTFLNYWNDFPCRHKYYNIFEHRIIVSSIYSREISCYNNVPVLFHPSDFFLFGLTDDVKNYFKDTRMATNEELGNWQYLYPNKIPYPNALFRYAPEQFFCLSYVKKFFPEIKYEDWSDWNETNTNLSLNILYNNFIFLDYKQSGIFSEKHSAPLLNSPNIKGLINFEKYQQVYKNQYDKDYEIETIMIPENIIRYNKYKEKCKEHLYNFINPIKKITTWIFKPISIVFYSLKICCNSYFIKKIFTYFIIGGKYKVNPKEDL
jgi:hypothetical protein